MLAWFSHVCPSGLDWGYYVWCVWPVAPCNGASGRGSISPGLVCRRSCPSDLLCAAVRCRSFNEATVPNPNGPQTFVWPHLLQWHNLRTRGPETLHRADSKHSIDDTLDTTLRLTPSLHELPGQVSQITSQRDTVPHPKFMQSLSWSGQLR